MSRKLFKSTLVTGGMTLVSRISGLARDIIFAGLIGAGAGVAADAFYVAFRIPNFLRRIFGEGAFSQAFVPVFTEYKTRSSQGELRVFVDRIAGILSVVLFLITLAGVIAAPVLVFMLAPGFTGEKYELTVQMLRLTFPYLFFISLVAMAAGILNSYGRFGAAAFTPVLLNLCMISAALWLAPHLHNPAMALAWGVFGAGVVQLLFQIPFLMQIKLLPRPRVARGHAGVSKVLRLMLPAMFGVSVAQINMLVNTILASLLVTGSVSWLYYSDRLLEFPLGVFGIALATVILPSLSQKHTSDSPQEFSHLLDWAMRLTFLIGVPATVALVLLAGPMLATMFHRGAFTAVDVAMSAQALVAFSIGLLGFLLIKVLAPGFYARQDIATPVRIAIIALVATQVMNALFVWPLGHAGLALSIGLAACMNAAMLWRLLVRRGIYLPRPGWIAFVARLVVAVLLMGAAIWLLAPGDAQWLDMGARPLFRVSMLAGIVGAGALVYFAALGLMGFRPADFRRSAN